MKIFPNTSHIDDLLDEELKLFYFNNSLMLAFSILERLSTLYNSFL